MAHVREAVVEMVRFLGPETARGRVHRAVMMVNYPFNRELAVLSAATGRMTRTDLRELLLDLKANGVTRLRAWRPNGRALPSATLVQAGPRYSEWEVDIDTALAVDGALIPGVDE